MVEYTVLCLVASFRFINIQSTLTLLLFSFLFISLTFQLNGTLSMKLSMLTLGNFVGFFWNLVFCRFAGVGVSYFGDLFNVFYVIIYPFLNLMWIVPFWSLSLGFLPKMQNLGREETF
jgi:hypothetical protein